MSIFASTRSRPSLAVLPAAAVAANEPDPIFAAIENHKKAWDAFSQSFDVLSRLERELQKDRRRSSVSVGDTGITDSDDPRWIEAEQDQARLACAEIDAAILLISVPPTTLEGALALLRHAIEHEELGREWPDGLCDEDRKYGKHWYSYLHRNLERTLSRLTGTA